MTHIITGLCMRHAGCVTVCPVDCIAPGELMEEWPYFYIDPEVCIDCGLCLPACPYNAIWSEKDVPPELREDIQPNYDYFQRKQGRVGPPP